MGTSHIGGQRIPGKKAGGHGSRAIHSNGSPSQCRPHFPTLRLVHRHRSFPPRQETCPAIAHAGPDTERRAPAGPPAGRVPLGMLRPDRAALALLARRLVIRHHQLEWNHSIKAQAEGLFAELRVRSSNDRRRASGALEFIRAKSGHKLHRCCMVQISNGRFSYTHDHRIPAAGAGWLRDQEHGEPAGALGSAIAQPLKLAALLRVAGDVHLKLTVADGDGAARRCGLPSSGKRPRQSAHVTTLRMPHSQRDKRPEVQR
jgi:hypothetical protein